MKKIFTLLTIILSISLQAQKVYLDTTYATNGVKKLSFASANDEQCLLSAVQADNKVVLCGYSTTWSPYAIRPFMCRLLENGDLDSTFNQTGVVIDSSLLDFIPYSMLIQDDGKIVLAGEWYTQNKMFGAVVRYNADGQIDSSFNQTGVAYPNYTKNVFGRTIQKHDNYYILGGYCNTTANDRDFFATKIDTDGVVDSTFGTNGILDIIKTGNQICRGVCINDDASIILSGYDEAFTPIVLKLNSIGVEDLTFTSNFTAANLNPYASFYQCISSDNDKLTHVGYSYNGGTGKLNGYLIRTDLQGALDPTFGVNGEVYLENDSNDVYAIYAAEYGDGNLLVVGDVGNISIDSMNVAAFKMDKNGVLDTSFYDRGMFSLLLDGGYDIFNAVNLSSNNNLIATGYYNLAPNIYKPVVVQFKIEELLSSLSNRSGGASNFAIFPNPIQNNTLQIRNEYPEEVSCSVYNGLGQIVTQNLKLNRAQTKEFPFLQEKGIYFIEFYTTSHQLLEQKVFLK